MSLWGRACEFTPVLGESSFLSNGKPGGFVVHPRMSPELVPIEITGKGIHAKAEVSY
jgi:hypothetical protein